MAHAYAALGPNAEPLLWMLGETIRGRKGALLTITALHGLAPRPLGTHMAVVSGKRFSGYLSGGGCVESAIATEFEPIIAAGRDSVLRFGKGSSIYDIRFPCGGGIDVLAHIAPRAELIEEALDRMAQRRAFALVLSPERNGASIYLRRRRDGPTGCSGDVTCPKTVCAWQALARTRGRCPSRAGCAI